MKKVFLSFLIFFVIGAFYAKGNNVNHFQRAMVLYNKGHYDAAIIQFKKYLNKYPNNNKSLNVYEYLASCYVFQKNPSSAKSIFRKLIKADPNYQLNYNKFPMEVQNLFMGLKQDLKQPKNPNIKKSDKNEGEKNIYTKKTKDEKYFNEGKNKYLLIIMREKIPSHKDVGHAPLKEEQTFYPSVQSSSI